VINALTTGQPGIVDHRNALAQHARYTETLVNLGLEVTTLPSLEAFPDSVFIEDAAVLVGELAILTRPGAATRRDEPATLSGLLSERFGIIGSITQPGTLDAGDVLQAGSHFFIGRSERTDEQGAGQLREILIQHGFGATIVPVPEGLHLKSGVAWLGQSTLLATAPIAALPVFADFDILTVPENETYAANSLLINDTVLVPAGFPATAGLLTAAGLDIHAVNVSEFQKLDGGLSCLSLRY
jgi:dimethylargininase